MFVVESDPEVETPMYVPKNVLDDTILLPMKNSHVGEFKSPIVSRVLLAANDDSAIVTT